MEGLFPQVRFAFGHRRCLDPRGGDFTEGSHLSVTCWHLLEIKKSHELPATGWFMMLTRWEMPSYGLLSFFGCVFIWGLWGHICKMGKDNKGEQLKILYR